MATVLAAMALSCAALPCVAQTQDRLAFAAGSDSGVAQGAVTGQAYADYLLGARAGQQMTVSLNIEQTDGYGTAYFNILPPGSDGVAIFNGSVSAENGVGQVDLPETGDYTVRVYLMGNDRDSAKTVEFALSVTITDRAEPVGN